MKSLWPFVLIGGGAVLVLASMAKAAEASATLKPTPTPPKPTPTPPKPTPPSAGPDEPLGPVFDTGDEESTTPVVIEGRQYLVIREGGSVTVQTDDGEEWIMVNLMGVSEDSVDNQRFIQMQSDIASNPAEFGLTQEEHLLMMRGFFG